MLTAQQKALVKAAIQADGTLPSLVATLPANEREDHAQSIADAFNLLNSPQWVVWRSRVTQDEITGNGFAWVEVDSLTVGKARIWEWLFLNSTRSINPSKANVRAGIAECWSGNAARNAVQAVVLGHCKRDATRIERVLSTGTGSIASPAVMDFEGEINPSDILDAWDNG